MTLQSTNAAAPRSFRHQAASVTLHLENEPANRPPISTLQYRCPLIAGAVNRSVTHLTVTGNVGALPGHFTGLDVETSPELLIDIVRSGKLRLATVSGLRQATAKCFNIPQQQVRYKKRSSTD